MSTSPMRGVLNGSAACRAAAFSILTGGSGEDKLLHGLEALLDERLHRKRVPRLGQDLKCEEQPKQL